MLLLQDKDKVRGSDVADQAANGCCFCYADALWTDVKMQVGRGFIELNNRGRIILTQIQTAHS